jgi:uncharacterized protein YbaA (DUF1428 family)
MSYVDGFILAVPKAKLDAYKALAKTGGAVWMEHGALSYVECVGDDVPYGELTSFPRAVQAKDDEVVIFSWVVYDSRESRDAVMKKVMADQRLPKDMSEMPFDGKRMIFGGFTPMIDERASGKTGYVDGYLAPVPAANKDAYREMAAKMAVLFKEFGAVRVVEAWGDFVPDGKVTDFKGAVKATADEQVVYSWIEWPSKQTRDEGWKKLMADPRMQGHKMPFDGKRMIYGGFAPILDA